MSRVRELQRYTLHRANCHQGPSTSSPPNLLIGHKGRYYCDDTPKKVDSSPTARSPSGIAVPRCVGVPSVAPGWSSVRTETENTRCACHSNLPKSSGIPHYQQIKEVTPRYSPKQASTHRLTKQASTNRHKPASILQTSLTQIRNKCDDVQQRED